MTTTMTTSSVLRQYEIIADYSSRMLAEARANQWDKVLALGQLYHAAVENLRHIEPLSDQERTARRGLLARILDDDANIRLLARPELNRLGALLGNMKRQQTVLQAYYHTSPDT
jgi:flagellar protein FliT